MAEFWSAVSPWIMPLMIGLVLWGQRTQSQHSSRILTQQAVHETKLEHIEKRIGRLERQEGR